MRSIFNMVDRRRVWKTLPDYPVFAPPFSYAMGWNYEKNWKIPSRDQIEQNYKYFLRHKADRLKYLADYLAPFSVELRFEPDALPPLGRWLYRPPEQVEICRFQRDRISKPASDAAIARGNGEAGVSTISNAALYWRCSIGYPLCTQFRIALRARHLSPMRLGFPAHRAQ